MLDVLVVDDDEIVRESISAALTSAGHEVAQARDGVEALELAAARSFDVAICDVQMPRLDGLTLLRRLRQQAPATTVIMMTSYGKIPDVVRTLRAGATDYVTKPFDPEVFAESVIKPIAERCALKKNFERARAEHLDRATGTHLVAESAAMRTLLDRTATIAQSDASVLILGEPGTGKKLLARRLHEQSPRREGPFVVVSSASIPELLVESERRDTNQGLSVRRDAWFRAAEGGSLILDGIEELPAAAQAALVCVLENAPSARRNSEWRPLGVRLVSIVNVEPDRLAGLLLPTLYQFVSTVTLEVPPLRARGPDLLPLVRSVLRDLTPLGRTTPTIEPGAWAVLSRYAFPRNISELVSVLSYAATMAGGGTIHFDHLPPPLH
jgi:two-component system response regulator HydG